MAKMANGKAGPVRLLHFQKLNYHNAELHVSQNKEIKYLECC